MDRFTGGVPVRATFDSWRRDGRTGSGFVTASDCRKHRRGALPRVCDISSGCGDGIEGETRDYAGRFFRPRCGSSVFSRSADEIE